MKLDPAILRSLSLSPADAAKASVSSHGGSGFASTIKISIPTADGTAKQFFGKAGRGADKKVMFAGEHESLNAIHRAVPSLCPASFGHGELESDPGSYFMVTDWLDIAGYGSGGGGGEGSGMSLAQKLAKLHTTPAPVLEGHEKPLFGFPETTCCGDTPQRNPYTESWADFYAEHRLRSILKRNEQNNGKDGELRKMVDRTADEVVPRLLSDGHLGGSEGIAPVVVHGDLWSGNKGRAQIAGRGAVEDVVFDPSACYAHSEYELGIMRMFGGFGGSFMREYHKLVPKTEPEAEYEDRVALYEL